MRQEDFYAYFKELLGDLYTKYDFENLVQVTDEDAFATARTLNSLGFSTKYGTNTTAVELFGQLYDELTEDLGCVTEIDQLKELMIEFSHERFGW